MQLNKKLHLVGFFVIFICGIGIYPFSAHAHISLAEWLNLQVNTTGFVDRPTIKDLGQWIQNINLKNQKYRDSFGRGTRQLQIELSEIEDQFYSRFDDGAKQEFQTLVAEVGAKMKNPILMPENQTPFWLLARSDLDRYRSSPQIPNQADIVVIGAGLTGASAAYHLRQVARDKKIVVIEAEERPAAQSSGRNGGNFQLLPENYIGDYHGLVEERLKWLSSIHRDQEEWNSDRIQSVAEKEAKDLLQFSYQNFLRFKNIIATEKDIHCDFSSKGWLRIASSKKEEAAIIEDKKWIDFFRDEMKDLPRIKIWSPKKIEAKTGIAAKFKGRFIYGNGNYHPYKFVVGLFKKALESGVELYTGVQVLRVENSTSSRGGLVVKTSEGEILASKVIVATNAFAPKLFPELHQIECRPSQVMNKKYVTNSLRGMTITERNGDIYYNHPKSTHFTDEEGRWGTLHIGLDHLESMPGDPAVLANLFKTEKAFQDKCEAVFREMSEFTDDQFPGTQGLPPSSMWAGPMAFTPDRVPIIGFMGNPNLILAVAFQGYGGSFTTQAGYVVAQMALTGHAPAGFPESLFSPERWISESTRQ